MHPLIPAGPGCVSFLGVPWMFLQYPVLVRNILNVWRFSSIIEVNCHMKNGATSEVCLFPIRGVKHRTPKFCLYSTSLAYTFYESSNPLWKSFLSPYIALTTKFFYKREWVKIFDLILKLWVSRAARKLIQIRVLYAENQDRLGLTYIGVWKSLDQTSIRKVCSIMETSGKSVNYYFVFSKILWAQATIKMPTDAFVKNKNCYLLKNASKILVIFSLLLFGHWDSQKNFFSLPCSYIIASFER